MNDPVATTWSFGGPLAGAPPEEAWTLLLVAASVCAVFAWISYRHAVNKLGVAPSALLVLLRTVFLVALLFCLANPVRIERQTSQPPDPPPPPPPPRLAVVVDRSDSMTKPDNRGRSRLDDALVTWRRMEKIAETHFAPAQYYSFAKDLRPATSLEEALARTGETSETRLYESIAALLKKNPEERPDAIVVLTDGLDTTKGSETDLRESALAAGVPVYFVAGTNRSVRPEPFLRVREWRAPGSVAHRTTFTMEATFEAFSRDDRSVRFSLWQGDRRIETGVLALTIGSNLVTRNFTVAAGEPGRLNFSLRLGESADSPVGARSVTQVLPPQSKTISLLLHQSALDWGFRYISDALRTDPSFEFLTIVTPDVGLTLARGGQRGSPVLGRLPDNEKALEMFDCVILAHPYPKQMTTAQQRALVNFTRNGGSVLIVSPDVAAVPQFDNVPLQEILPVVFAESKTVDAESRFFGRSGRADDPLGTGNLPSFSLTEAGKASPIFARAGGGANKFILPRFSESALVVAAKPGAEVLAVHPTARDPATGKPYILLAVQTFGRGRSAVLTTDALWRWKLSEPSASRVVETFWQQLLLAIGRRGETEQLRFVNTPAQLRIGQTVTLFLSSPVGEKRPSVLTRSPSGELTPLTVKSTNDADAQWSVEWKPNESGNWEIAAGVEGARQALFFPSVLAEEIPDELAATPPALEALRTLAGETGGALLAQEPPTGWRPDAQKEKPPETVSSERQFLRWNKWEVLWIALGAYALELIFRRFWRLL